MGAVADGHKLHQDLSKDGVARTEDHVQIHGKNSQEMQTWHHIHIQKDSLLYRLIKKPILWVNSIHHQAVKARLNGSSQAVAHDSTGKVIEALEGNKSVSVQSHIEFPVEISGNQQFTENGFQILKGIVAYARYLRIQKKHLCTKIFQ
jgi:gamma-glutamyl-gamma-aminobutyrate hydrolase PuuD